MLSCFCFCLVYINILFIYNIIYNTENNLYKFGYVLNLIRYSITFRRGGYFLIKLVD